ncbi:hypothetical protein FB451DRAFT_1447895 [Mycena latifolia]|nr:hypothetical protein FB451DRAFT_1447895 [Mycena latifolia]
MPVPKRGTPLVLFHDEQIPLLDGEPPSNWTQPTSKPLVTKTHMPAALANWGPGRRLRTAPPRSLSTASAWLRCASSSLLSLFPIDAKIYAAALVACLTACPAEVWSAEALVGQCCAAATKPTSLSFPSFIPSSTSASNSASSASNSGAGSSTATAPASFSPAPTTTPSNAAAAHKAHRLGLPLGDVAASLAGVRLGAALLREHFAFVWHARHRRRTYIVHRRFACTLSRADAVRLISVSYAVFVRPTSDCLDSAPHTTSVRLQPESSVSLCIRF